MIDINKTYRTRDGREVRIYATDGGVGNSIHGAFKDANNIWRQHCWREDGNDYYSKSHDLIEVRPRIKRTVWVNVYKEGQTIHPDLAHDYNNVGMTLTRLACVRVEIDCEEGEGL